MELSCTLCRQQTYLFYSAWNRIENNSNQNTRMPSIVDKNILIACTWRRALFYSIFTNERIGTNSTKCQILTSYLTIRYDLLFSNFVVACQNGTRKSGTGLIYSSERNMRVIEARKLKKKTFDRSRRQKTFP